MRLLEQILREAGADTDGAFTVVPSFGAYFKRVKRVEEYAANRVCLQLPAGRAVVSGEGLVIEKYFQQDLFIRGRVEGVNLE